jgi:hypothetical protein
MHINGWQRVWVLASILWAVVILALAGRFQPNGEQVVQSANMVALRIWIVPVVGAYALGLGLAWVRRGFQVVPGRAD